MNEGRDEGYEKGRPSAVEGVSCSGGSAWAGPRVTRGSGAPPRGPLTDIDGSWLHAVPVSQQNRDTPDACMVHGSQLSRGPQRQWHRVPGRSVHAVMQPCTMQPCSHAPCTMRSARAAVRPFAAASGQRATHRGWSSSFAVIWFSQIMKGLLTRYSATHTQDTIITDRSAAVRKLARRAAG